jgi:RNA-directed DNA polymerase
MVRIGVETSLHTKVGRRPYGLSSQESLKNHLNGRRANERSINGACTFRRGLGRHQLGRCSTPGKRATGAYCEGDTGGRHNRAKALQWLLTHSFSGKALAVKRVTENKGKNTAGVDKITWQTPAAKINAIASLKRRGYSTLPLRRVLIPKKNGTKTRPLGIPVMKCRAMQALHLLALEPIAETTADLNSYGFRPERSTADAGAQCFNSLAKKASAEWVLEADIKGCFDNISHDWMIANIPTDKAVLKKWLKAGYAYQNELFPTEAGTPQGGIISPAAANMTLDGLEAMLLKKFPKAKQTGRKMNMVRYADDFIITGYSKEWLEQEVKPAVVEFLAERGLVLSPEKTKITNIADGFDFLGWNLRKYNGKLLIKPSKANVKGHLDKIREVIKANKTAKQANLIRLLNPGTVFLSLPVCGYFQPKDRGLAGV